ncbi:hypothetical protein B0A52_03934 [Exophiala mesophila]|uniref:AB hydrolase-1 domain-containing protein n=1 Tax=Exophiala mesophila TaxID=212818 RepID=A0A438N7K7_EXOME|nr:hypothetical protein B0A52_03934 [Exophiala mesophila]
MDIHGSTPAHLSYDFPVTPSQRQPNIPGPDLSQSSAADSAQPVQVISSLINSLSAITAAAKQDSDRDDFDLVQYQSQLSTALPAAEPAEDLERDSHNHPIIDDSSDDQAAVAPVIRYARRPPAPQKRSTKSRFSSLVSNQPCLTTRESQQSLRSRAETESVGVVSIDRKRGSSASSTFSLLSGFSVPRRRLTSESLRDMATRPVAPKRLSSDRRRRPESLSNIEQERDMRFPIRTSSLDEYSGQGHIDDPAVEAPILPVINRLSKLDSANHAIPSRRSSLRKSLTGVTEQSDAYRYPTENNKLKELNIDADLIEGDNSTVRRIRELQEAREQRQREWRNEARKSEKAAKRHTIATAKVSRRSSPYPTSRLSVTDVVLESPEVDIEPLVSATVTASDLAIMPALVSQSEEPVRPHQSNSNGTAPSLSRNNSTRIHGRNPVQPLKRSSITNSVKLDSSLSEIRAISDEVESFLGAPRFTQKIRHPRTGRTIAFSEVGDPDGFVVLCCVGMGLTRYLTAFYDELARTLRLRLITPDRTGVGESSALPEASCTPLNWVDDVAVICSSLEITRFSLLAHSAGAIYALAAALKMPQFVRGRIHLLAPWIPPSQMPKGAALGPDSQPIANLPISHRILSVLPAQILKVANSRFLTATSASVDAKPLKKKTKPWENFDFALENAFQDVENDPAFGQDPTGMDKENVQKGDVNRPRSVSCYETTNTNLGLQSTAHSGSSPESQRQGQLPNRPAAAGSRPVSPRLTAEARQSLYNQSLTHRIWALATMNANPAQDLVVCLERRRTIGFRYAEVTRSVVIHHGARDSRVPLDNVRWLQSVMKRCDLRVLETEGHGLMASASAMSTVLSEIAKEWEEWEKIAMGKEKKKKKEETSSPAGSRPRRGSNL